MMRPITELASDFLLFSKRSHPPVVRHSLVWTAILAMAWCLALPLWGQVNPVIVSTVPAYGAMGVSPTAPVVITFSAAMNTNVTEATFYDLTTPMTPLTLTKVWNAAGTQVTYTPTPTFGVSKTIVFSVEGESVLGATLEGNTGSMFTTGTGGPSIVQVTPANLATEVAPNTTVVFTFSVAMNTNVTLARFYDSAAPTTFLPVSVAWRADKLQLTCTPTTPFPAGKTIMWNVLGESLTGAALEGGSGLFMTSGTAPMLLGSIPLDLATSVPTNTPVVFTFNVAMNTNLTTAQFRNAAAPLNDITFAATWNAARTQLTCTPTPGFPPGATMEWTVNGRDDSGNAILPANGSFSTAGTGGGPTPIVAMTLLSRGGTARQTTADLLEVEGHEFLALASDNLAGGALVIAPSPGGTHVLSALDWPGALEFRDSFDTGEEFATNYAAGDYRAAVLLGSNYATATMSLSDGPLPAAPQLLNWSNAPYALLGQNCQLQWEIPPTGAQVDYLHVRVEKGGTVIFASPVAGMAGALTGSSNRIVIPATVFTNTGRAEVSLTAINLVAANTNAIAGVKVMAGRHRTTLFTLRVVDGAVPQARLVHTNVVNLPTGEEILRPLATTNHLRPLQFALVGGALPAGLTLESWGALAGQTASVGTYNALVRITDLLGRSSTQPLQVVTVPLPPDATPPKLENMRRESGTTMRFELVGPPGLERVIDRSLNLTDWLPFLTTNPPSQRLTVRTPLDQRNAFFRVRAPAPVVPPARPLHVTPVLNTNRTVTGTLDEWGGTLRLTNAAGYVFALDVPPGALDRRETITMTDISRIDGLPLSGGLRAAVDLKPDGLMFNDPARLDITYPATPDQTRVLGFGARPGGGHFALQPSFITNRTVSLYLWHFSMAGAGDGSAGDAGAQAGNGPDDPMTSLQQQVAATLAACKADPACAENPSETFAGLADTYVKMADQVVIPKLDQAIANDAVLDDAIRTWLKWLKDLALLGLHDGDLSGNGGSFPELNKRVTRAYSKACKAINNGMTKACQDCLNHQIERIYRMLELARWSALLGMDDNSLDRVEACATKCLVFEIQIESEIVGSDGSAIYNTHTKGKAKLRPQTGGNDDSGTVMLQRLKLVFTGSGSWDITELQHTVPAGCTMQTASKSGRVDIPWASIQLYQKRETYVPGQGAVTSYVFNPDMTLKLRSGLEIMPKEGRVLVCPKAPPANVADIFKHTFHAFHNDEVQLPEGLALEFLGGPVFNITGFTPGGPEDVILSKPYFRTLSVATENTLIDLRHTPGK